MSKCCNRDCNNTAIGTIIKGGKLFRRCQYHESQHESNNTSRVIWKSVDIGKGVCRRKNCSKFVGKNDVMLCDMHNHHNKRVNKLAYYKKQEYKERAKIRNASLRLKANRDEKMVRPHKDPVGIASVIKSHEGKLFKNIDSLLQEIYA